MTPVGPGGMRAQGSNACGVGCGPEECGACGVSCGGGGAGAGNGAMSYVGCGQGEYVQETVFKYVGYGGDFDVNRPRRDFTCLITTCCLLSLLCLIPLLCWLFGGGSSTSLPFDCQAGLMSFETGWSLEKKDFCCETQALGCTTVPLTTVFPATTPTQPPTPFPSPVPFVPIPRPFIPVPRPFIPVPKPTVDPNLPPPDPWNCATGVESQWPEAKKTWCCDVHHKACPPTAPPVTMPPTPPPFVPVGPVPYVPVGPVVPARPADPYNCAEGYANWMAGWSVPKKEWCCKVHGKGCPGSGGGGCATTSKPYDCQAGFENWLRGWSVGKKDYCCKNEGKGCPPAGGGCA